MELSAWRDKIHRFPPKKLKIRLEGGNLIIAHVAFVKITSPNAGFLRNSIDVVVANGGVGNKGSAVRSDGGGACAGSGGAS